MLLTEQSNYELSNNDYYIYYHKCLAGYDDKLYLMTDFNDCNDGMMVTLYSDEHGYNECLFDDLDVDIEYPTGIYKYKKEVWYITKAIGQSPYKYRRGCCPYNYVAISGLTIRLLSDFGNLENLKKLYIRNPQEALQEALNGYNEPLPVSDDVYIIRANNIIRIYYKAKLVGRYYKSRESWSVIPSMNFYMNLLGYKYD